MVKQKMKLDTPGDVNSMLASMAVGASAPVEKKEEGKKPAPVPAPAKPKRKVSLKQSMITKKQDMLRRLRKRRVRQSINVAYVEMKRPMGPHIISRQKNKPMMISWR